LNRQDEEDALAGFDPAIHEFFRAKTYSWVRGPSPRKGNFLKFCRKEETQ